MDKYELSIKEDKIKKHAEKKDYAAAMKIADTIDWSKVKNIKILTLVSQVYEKAKHYEEAKNVLLFAYERVPMGRRMLYKLTELCVKEGKLEEAESYFDEFQKIAPNDIGKLLLAYQIEAAKDGDLNKMITILELYRKNEFEERWAYELAHLYHRAGRVKECVQLCNEIILWFSVGTYVDRALNLKMQYEPLTPAEQEKLVNKKKFEARVRAVEREFERRESRGIREEESEEVERRRKKDQLREAAMTSELSEDFRKEASEEVPEETMVTEEVVLEQEPLFADDLAEASAPGKVIPFAAVSPASANYGTSEMEETSAEAERLFFAEEEVSAREPEAESLPGNGEPGELPDGEKEAYAGEFDIRASLAQSVREVEREPQGLGEEPAGETLSGQTKEVVRETKRALKQETKTELGQTGEFLNDVSTSLAEAVFAAEKEASPAVLRDGGAITPEKEPAASREELPRAEASVTETEVSAAKAEETEVSIPKRKEKVPEAEPAALKPEEAVPESETPKAGAEVSIPKREEEAPETEPAVLRREETMPEGEAPAPKREEKVPEAEPAVLEPGEATESETPETKAEEAEVSVPKREEMAQKAEPAAPKREERVPEAAGEFEITCVVVEAEPGAGRIPFAVEKLKKTHEVLGSKATQVAKISGEKLSSKGVKNTFKRLAGRDLIVDNAADLSHEAAAELTEEMKRPAASLVLILVDSSARMNELLVANPELDQLCVYLEEGGQMDVDEFVACACEYAKSEECVIDEMARLAIFAVAERLQNDGEELAEETAKRLVDEAIERAEHRGIKGLFGAKYDKEGYLILKEQFFKNL
ncbi:MAG: hypothetical protein HFI64_00520 [Lachnospiraceae bacterium]|nr:hypothetical protein [Lachnospiraceae bacterium]